MSSPGNVAVYHGKYNAERWIKIAELVLRIMIMGLGIVSASVIVSVTEVKLIFSMSKKATFTDMKSLVRLVGGELGISQPVVHTTWLTELLLFLVVANVIVAAYSLVQIVRCVVGMIRGSVLFSKPLAWLIFSADQVMAYLSLAAVAAAVESSALGKFGQMELSWMKTCVFFEKFCNEVGEGIAGSLVVTLCAVILSSLSAYSLFRLYGARKGKNDPRW